MSLDQLTRPMPGMPPTGGGGRPGRGATLGVWFRKLVTGAVLIALPVCVGAFADKQLGAAWGAIPMFVLAPDKTFVNIAAGLAFLFAAGVSFALLRGGERLRDRIGDRAANVLLVVAVVAAVVLPILRTPTA